VSASIVVRGNRTIVTGEPTVMPERDRDFLSAGIFISGHELFGN